MYLENTHAGADGIGAALAKRKKLRFIGVGGVQMSSLALAAAARGFAVSGSDSVESAGTARVRRAGIPVFIGEDAVAAAAADAGVFTLAISPENAEYRALLAAGNPLFSRADFLAYLTSPYPRRIGVAGSHGKSTVTAMLTEIFAAARRSPTAFCGAEMPRFGGGYLAGEGEDVVFEACEYRDSFLCLSPTLAIVLNIALDHTDYFPDLAAVRSSFAAYVRACVARGGAALCRAEDAALFADAGEEVHTFGRGGEYTATEISFREGFASFSPARGGESFGRVTLKAAGEHQIGNALAAAAAADISGVPRAVIVSALSDFRGIDRRFTERGALCGARVFEDYAHHPAEIAAVLGTARAMTKGRLFAVFQPHTYSRTAAFLSEIAAALCAADRVWIAPIFAARERDTGEVSAARLAAAIGKKAAALSLKTIAAELSDTVRAGDTVVVMGAGDVGRLFGEFSAKDFTSCPKSGTIREE